MRRGRTRASGPAIARHRPRPRPARRCATSRGVGRASPSRDLRAAPRRGGPPPNRDAPPCRVVGDGLEVRMAAEHRRGRFRAPAPQAREAVGRVPDEREPVGNRCGADAPARAHRLLVDHESAAAIELHDAFPGHALREVLVRGANEHATHPRIAPRERRGGRERVVRLVLDHRPDREAEGSEGVFERTELGVEHGVHALARLVSLPELVAERLDHVVGRDADVPGPLAQESQHGSEHTAHRADLATADVLVRRKPRVEVAEQLVGPVDHVDREPRGAGSHRPDSYPGPLAEARRFVIRPAR